MKTREKSKATVKLLLIVLFFGAFIHGRTANDEIVQYSIQKPDEISRGNEFQVSIQFFIKPGWYIYAPTGLNAAQGTIETKVVLILPKGITRSGKVKLPKPKYKDGHEVYLGNNVVIDHQLKSAFDLTPGQYEIRGRVMWQACNSDICLPPTEEDIVVLVNIR